MKTILQRLMCMVIAAMACMSVNAQATSGSCGDNATWSYESTTLTISGTGEMADYEYGETPWKDYAETMTSLVIEEGITSIGANAFAGCEKLNSVNYPSTGFTSIGDYAFSGAKVKNVNLPRTLTHLGTGAFSSCQTKGVAIPASLKKIGDYAFESCANLEGVSIYEGVEEIGESAFDGCALTSITIPNSVTTIGGGAFMSNEALTSVYIGSGVKTIGAAAFQGCAALKKVGIGGGAKPALGDAVFTDYEMNPLAIEAFYVSYGTDYSGWGGFDAELFKTEYLGTWTNSEDEALGSGNWRFDILEGKLTVSGTGKLNVAPWNDEPAINPFVYQDEEHPGFWGGIKSAVFMSGITSLENMACGMQINCASVTLPSTLKTITNSALEECAFTSIELPEGLETIDMYAFFGSKLTSLVIPSTVTKLGYSVFLYNEDLEVVTMLPTTPPTLEAELPFGECEALTAIYVPTGCAATYQAAEGWSTYAALIQDAPTTTFTYTASEKVTKFDTF
ncbi:MAG: leucine-rich repeat domain-containing protein, partial [Bacteroidaceae bacterium]|nr:leucine-rich repeat domain-containing protein [Bacteroidaceae bacterium]